MPLRPRTPEALWAEMLTRRHVTETGCWEYIGQHTAQGYGKLKWMGITTTAHRIAAAIKLGHPLKGRDNPICHSCNNPPCFNPEHLYDGTPSTNQLDSVLRGTHHEALKTHCPKGHPYDSSNTVIDEGKRRCRECRLARQREWWAAHGNEWRRARKEKLKWDKQWAAS